MRGQYLQCPHETIVAFQRSIFLRIFVRTTGFICNHSQPISVGYVLAKYELHLCRQTPPVWIASLRLSIALCASACWKSKSMQFLLLSCTALRQLHLLIAIGWTSISREQQLARQEYPKAYASVSSTFL